MCYNIRMSEHIYTVSQFAKKLGVAIKTLQRWDRQGILKARRTLTNRRYYTDEDYDTYLQRGGNTGATHEKDQAGGQ